MFYLVKGVHRGVQCNWLKLLGASLPQPLDVRSHFDCSYLICGVSK